MNISNFIEELKRRNVIKVATAYAIAGWLIIQIATSVFPAFEFPNWTTQFVIILIGIGFPLSLIFAWAFELTPEGIKKSKEVDITESVTSRTGKKLNGIIIAVLSVAVFFLVIERVFFAKASILENDASNIETASIAVLPFVNMSSDEENEYFSDGLSEELLNGLAKIEGMQVAGRTSSFSFKGKNEDIRVIADQLEVKHILEGSVRKEGNTLRITAQLIQADNGFHLWSETYDREIESIFAIQEEITRKVVQELKVRLLPQEEIQLTERPTQDIEAYNAYLEATQIEVNRSVTSLNEAISKYEDAIRIDPTFAEAYARLAIAHYLSYGYGFERSDEQLEEVKVLIRENIDQAQLLNPNLGHTFLALGMYFGLTQELDKSEAAHLKAANLMPNDAIAQNSLFVALRDNDKDTEAYRTLEKAYHLDPLNPVVARNYANYLKDIKREFDQALRIYDQIIENYPDYMPIKAEKAWLLRDIPYGRQDEAFTYMFEAYKSEPENFNNLNQLAQIAMDVELYPYAMHIIKQVDAIYSNNSFASINLTRIFYFGTNDMPKLEDVLLELIEKEERASRENFEGQFQRLALAKGDYEEVLTSIEKTSPELLLENPAVADSNQFFTQNYIAALRKLGMNERAKKVAELYCADIPETVEDLEEGRDISWIYVMQIQCYAFLGNYDKAIEGSEKLYFEENSKANWPSLFNSNPEDIILSEEPGYVALKARILEDLHEKRANIIEFLKAEGEWRDEWEISNKN